MEISSTNQSSDSGNSSQELEYHLEESKLDSDPSSYSSKHSQSYDDESSIGTIIDLGEETIMEEENYWEKCLIEETLLISLLAFCIFHAQKKKIYAWKYNLVFSIIFFNHIPKTFLQ